MNNGINLQNCTIQPVIHDNSNARISWDVLRLDEIHPRISGNKYFKLKYYLENALKNGKTGLVSFGGAWSNHILAVAEIAKMHGLQSAGLIRGEQSDSLSPTLRDAMDLGMELIFVPRTEFSDLSRNPTGQLQGSRFEGWELIPEGGYGLTGALGAAEIMDFVRVPAYDLIFCACGTGTTLAGLISRATEVQQCIGIPVLRNARSLKSEIQEIVPPHTQHTRWDIIDGYHFGGYARGSEILTSFMNHFYEINRIPTDFVYTGKLMFAINDLILNNYFPEETRILAIHSGGLQGNRSLKKGRLSF